MCDDYLISSFIAVELRVDTISYKIYFYTGVVQTCRMTFMSLLNDVRLEGPDSPYEVKRISIWSKTTGWVDYDYIYIWSTFMMYS